MVALEVDAARVRTANDRSDICEAAGAGGSKYAYLGGASRGSNMRIRRRARGREPSERLGFRRVGRFHILVAR